MTRTEWRDPRFIELNRLIRLGQGNVRRPGPDVQTVECVNCHRQFAKLLEKIDPDQAQRCDRCRIRNRTQRETQRLQATA